MNLAETFLTAVGVVGFSCVVLLAMLIVASWADEDKETARESELLDLEYLYFDVPAYEPKRVIR